MSTDWHFPSNGDGQKDGFNQAAIDIWQGSMIYSIVRETIQNSIDARLIDSNDPASVTFSFHSIVTPLEVQSLTSVLEVAQQTAKDDLGENHDADAHGITDFYKNAITKSKLKTTDFFAIQDFNTTGLVGETKQGQPGSSQSRWLALVKSTGVSVQRTATAGGAYGHGSKAPFALGALRTVFYLTRCNHENELVSRYQGKSILQSMYEAGNKNKLTQNTGYFGTRSEIDGIQPLVNSSIPHWVTEIRDKYGSGTGTSILIPWARLEKSEIVLKHIELAVLASFYMAIKSKKLIVTIGDESPITDENLIDRFDQALIFLESQGDEDLAGINKAVLKDNIEASKTIRNSDVSGVARARDFGEFEWFMRIGDSCVKSQVGISRELGMLITKKAPNLEYFPAAKTFDMFVVVTDPKASAVLRVLENPAHDAFEFDRVTNAEKLTSVRKSYNSFKNKVREIIKENAPIDLENEVSIDDFDLFFDGGLDDSTNHGDNRLTRQVVIGKVTRPKIIQGMSKLIEDEDQDGEGMHGGKGKRRSEGGPNPAIGAAGGLASTPQAGKKTLKNFRVVPSGKQNIVDVYFTPMNSTSAVISLFKSGDSLMDQLKVKVLDSESTDWFTEIPIKLDNKSARIKVTLELEPGALDYAIEGRYSDA
jgi:hypothetical protein